MKIWRYMDLAKFISLLSNQALYFTSPNKFDDPYEFNLPQCYLNELQKNQDEFKENSLNQLKNTLPNLDQHPSYTEILQNYQKMPSASDNIETTKVKFGVNCWHINEFENEALWKIYTQVGQGIAIETTTQKLQESLTYHNKIYCDVVRYEDFDNATISKGFNHYNGFIKRKAF